MTEVDGKKVCKLFKENGNRKVTEIHNHPSYFSPLGGFFGGPVPSSGDFVGFLNDDRVKTMVIAQNNSYSGKLEGYGVYRKTKKTLTKRPNIFQRFFYETATSLGFSKLALEYYENKFGIKSRFVPAESYRLNNFKTKFVRNKSSDLEKTVTISTAVISITSLVISLFFFSSNITGNVVGNLDQTSSKWIGGILFVIGIIGALFYLRDK